MLFLPFDASTPLETKIAAVAAIANQLPGVVIINHMPAGNPAYMSPRGEALLRVPLAEMLKMDGPTYIERFFNPADAADYRPLIMEMLERNEPNAMVTHFQQVRASAADPWSWYSTSSTVFHRDSDGHPTHLLSFAVPIDAARHVTAKVRRLLEEKTFRQQFAPTFALLTLRERDVLRLLAQGNRTQQVADTLLISVQTAETHRRNLRKKLGSETAFHLGQFARAFDLV